MLHNSQPEQAPTTTTSNRNTSDANEPLYPNVDKDRHHQAEARHDHATQRENNTAPCAFEQQEKQAAHARAKSSNSSSELG